MRINYRVAGMVVDIHPLRDDVIVRSFMECMSATRRATLYKVRLMAPSRSFKFIPSDLLS